MSDTESIVKEAFPELSAIDDESLRAGVVDAWTQAITETELDPNDLPNVPWFPPDEHRLGIDGETLLEHVRDVTQGALAFCDLLQDRRNQAVSRDLVTAGALCHDVSKLYEFDEETETPIGNLLGHPHYGVHVVATAELPVEVMHITLSHSGRTAVDPAILEAEIVRRADEVAAAAIRSEAVSDLRSV